MFGIPRIHPITIHEFLNLTYLGSTPPQDVTAYQMHGFFWVGIPKNLRINGLLLAAMGTHVSFIFRYFLVKKFGLSAILHFFKIRKQLKTDQTRCSGENFRFVTPG